MISAIKGSLCHSSALVDVEQGQTNNKHFLILVEGYKQSKYF